MLNTSMAVVDLPPFLLFLPFDLLSFRGKNFFIYQILHLLRYRLFAYHFTMSPTLVPLLLSTTTSPVLLKTMGSLTGLRINDVLKTEKNSIDGLS